MRTVCVTRVGVKRVARRSKVEMRVVSEREWSRAATASVAV